MLLCNNCRYVITVITVITVTTVTTVIASVAKQSMVGAGTLHGLLRYARNDGSDSSVGNDVAAVARRCQQQLFSFPKNTRPYPYHR